MPQPSLDGSSYFIRDPGQQAPDRGQSATNDRRTASNRSKVYRPRRSGMASSLLLDVIGSAAQVGMYV